MTSKKLSLENDMKKSESSKNTIGFFSLVRESLRTDLWLLLLGIVVMFFAYPVNMGMQMSYCAGRVREAKLEGDTKLAAEFLEDMAVRANRVLTGEYSFLWIIVFVAAVLCAVGIFGWCYNKNKVDFYNSQPVTRSRRFWSLYLSGVLIMAVCLFAGVFSSLVIALIYGVSPVMMKETILVNLGYMAVFLLIYSTAIAAVMLTGNKMTFFMAYLWICIFAFVLSGIITTFGGIYFKTAGISADLINNISKLSPVYWEGEYYNAISRLVYNDMFAQRSATTLTEATAALESAVTVIITASALISLTAFAMFKKRDSESAGKALAFGITRRPLRILFTIIMALVFCIFGAYIGIGINADDIFWTLFFLVAGAVLFHGIIELIYTGDIRSVMRDKAELLICIAVSVLVVGSFRYDVFGYDRYVPEADKVESIEISSSDFLPDKNATRRADFYMIGFSDYDYSDENIKITGEKDIEAVLEMIKNSNELTGKEENEGYYSRYTFSADDFDSYDHFISFTIKYKSGGSSERRYNIAPEYIREYLAPILEKPEAKEMLFPVTGISQEDFGILGIKVDDASKFDPFAELYIYGYSLLENINDKSGRDEAYKVFEALKKDLMEADFDDIVRMDYYDNEDRRSLIYVPKETVDNKNTELRETGLSLQDSGYDISEEYPVLDTFDDTRAAIEELGY